MRIERQGRNHLARVVISNEDLAVGKGCIMWFCLLNITEDLLGSWSVGQGEVAVRGGLTLKSSVPELALNSRLEKFINVSRRHCALRCGSAISHCDSSNDRCP